MEGTDGAINQLLVQLPQAKNSTETFSLFAEKVHHIFPGLCSGKGVSLLLLPSEASSDSGSVQQPGASMPAHAAQGKGAGGKAAAAKGGSSASGAGQKHTGLQSNGACAGLDSNMQAFRTGCGLDWSNCCVFNLYAGRGPVVQAPPSWPVSCTATCYAAVTARDVVVTGNYAAHGPHFLDWKALAEHGCVSMAAVPMCSCNRPVAVLCLASTKPDAFASVATLKLLGGLLAPYCSMLTYSTRVMEMRRLVNEIITPIAAQLAQQKSSQLARLGCTVEEAPPGSVPVDGKGISVAVGSHGRNSNSSSSTSTQQGGVTAGGGSSSTSNNHHPATAPVPVASIGSNGPTIRQRKGPAKGGAADAAAGVIECSSKAGQGAGGAIGQWDGSNGAAGGLARGKYSQSLSHKQFESVIVKGSEEEGFSGFSSSSDVDMDWSDFCWSDFFFNLVSMAIVYAYFSKAAVAGESMVAVLLCMGVAAFDIVLLVMRWLWWEQYINYGSVVMAVFQAYRVIVLPIANTWMSWSLLHKMSITPSWPLIVLLGAVLLACIIMGLQVRFFLHAPLQLASVLFAATSTPDICGAFFESTSNIRCIGIISALQLSLGLVLPSLAVYLLEGRSGGGRAFLPHMQAKVHLHV